MSIIVVNKKKQTVIVEGKLTRKPVEFRCDPANREGCWDRYAARYAG